MDRGKATVVLQLSNNAGFENLQFHYIQKYYTYYNTTYSSYMTVTFSVKYTCT